MKVVLKHKGVDILSYDTEFDPGIGHLMVVVGCLLDSLMHENPERINVEIDYIKIGPGDQPR